MGAAERTEEVLRDIHVLFSKAQPVEGSKKRVIVDKDKMMDLLKKLNDCMYDMMDEHELTEQSRDKANRELKKQGDDIIFDARKNAEDVYAASIIYSDQALSEICDIISRAQDNMQSVHDDMLRQIMEKRREVKDNQYELKSQLQDFIDTQKYMHLIEEENIRRAKEKESGGGEPVSTANEFVAETPEIRINEDYFKSAGIPVDEDNDPSGNTKSEADLEAMSADLDAEYFDWKDGGAKEHPKPKSIFPSFLKKK